MPSAPSRAPRAAGADGRRRHGRPHLAAARHRRRAAAGLDAGRSRSPPSAPRAGSRSRVVPEAGYPLELIPPVPLPRRPSADLARLPGRLRGAVTAALEVVDRVRPDVVVGFGGYVSVPAYLAARKRRLPDRRARGQRPARHREQARRPVHHARRDQLPRHRRCGTRRYLGLPIRRMISTLDRPALRGRGPRRTSASTPTAPTLLVTGGSQGARRLNQSVSAAPSPRSPPPASRCCTSSARQGEVDGARPATGDAAVRRGAATSTAWTSPTPRPTWSSAGPGANTVTEVAAVGLPAVFVPLPIGNGEQALNARPVVDAGGGLLVDDARLHRRVGRGDRARPGHRHRRGWRRCRAPRPGLIPRDADEQLARMVLARRGVVGREGPRPRRAAAAPTRSAGCTSSASAAPACPASPGSCWPAASRSAAATPRSPARSTALRALGAQVHVGHRAEQVARRRHRRGLHRGARGQPRGRGGAAPGAAAAAALGRPRVGDAATARVVAVAGTHGKTTTTSLLTVALQHCGADPSFAIGGELNESGSNAHDGSGDLFVAEADESDGAFLVYSPHRRPGDQRRGRPPRQLRHRGGLPRRLLARSSTGSGPAASWSPCVDDPGAADLAGEARERGLEVIDGRGVGRGRPAGRRR